MVTLKPTTPLLAPRQGSLETGIASAPENCTKNTHFAPAKAMVVSDRPTWPTGPDCGAHGRRQGLAGQRGDAPRQTSAHQAPRVWRVPEGRRTRLRCRWAAAGPGRASTQRTKPHVSTPSAAGVEGAGGSGGHGRASRSTTPSRRLACGDLAGGRARRRPEHQRSHKQQHTARTSRGRAAAHRHTQRPGPPVPGTPVGPQQNEAATGFPATASSRSRSAVHNSTASDQAVMST